MTTPSRAARPRDRKQVIANNARDLFARRGFNVVRMEDIAAETGITPRALYRHYRSKQHLLSEIFHESQQLFLDAFAASAQLSGDFGAQDQLDNLIERLVAASLDSPHFAVLWQREARYLQLEDVRRFRRRLAGMAIDIAALITAGYPALDAAQAQIRAWAVLAIAVSPGHDDPVLSRSDSRDLLIDCARVAVRAPAGRVADSEEPLLAPAAPQWSRREQLLAAAAAAFRRDGYQAVGINEIGGEAGIAGPSIYRYFRTKGDVLMALFQRFGDWRTLETYRAIGAGRPDAASEVVHRLVEAYARLCAQWPDLVSVVVTESMSLDPEDYKQVERTRKDLHRAWGDWAALARSASAPELLTVQRLVEVAMVLIEDTARIRLLGQVPELVPELAAVTAAVLLTTQSG